MNDIKEEILIKRHRGRPCKTEEEKRIIEEEKEQNIKRPVGRPRKSEEEKILTKKIYGLKYQNNRYKTDEVYRIRKNRKNKEHAQAKRDII